METIRVHIYAPKDPQDSDLTIFEVNSEGAETFPRWMIDESDILEILAASQLHQWDDGAFEFDIKLEKLKPFEI